jgi:hypothetical protein
VIGDVRHALARVVAIVAVVAVVAAGCDVDRGRDVADIEGMFPTLEALDVRSLTIDEDCERIAYERGSYASACDGRNAWVAGELRVQDARSDLDTIERASRALGRRLTHAYPLTRAFGTCTIPATVGCRAMTRGGSRIG